MLINILGINDLYNYITDTERKIWYFEDFADILYNITCIQDKYILHKRLWTFGISEVSEIILF